MHPRLTSTAVWEKSSKDGTRKAFFAHFATKTLQDATRGPRVLNKAFTEFRTATNLGNDLPDAVWLYMAAKDGGEFNEEGNNLVREQLKKAGIEKHEVTEEMYTLPARGTEKVELRPGEASLENMLVRIGVVGA